MAHEPPLATVLPDQKEALGATEDIHETYHRDGLGPAMAKFIAITSLTGPIPTDFPDHVPNPADFGLPTEDDGSRDHPMLGPHMVTSRHYKPDFDSLRGPRRESSSQPAPSQRVRSPAAPRWPWRSGSGPRR